MGQLDIGLALLEEIIGDPEGKAVVDIVADDETLVVVDTVGELLGEEDMLDVSDADPESDPFSDQLDVGVTLKETDGDPEGDPVGDLVVDLVGDPEGEALVDIVADGEIVVVVDTVGELLEDPLNEEDDVDVTEILTVGVTELLAEEVGLGVPEEEAIDG